MATISSSHTSEERSVYFTSRDGNTIFEGRISQDPFTPILREILSDVEGEQLTPLRKRFLTHSNSPPRSPPPDAAHYLRYRDTLEKAGFMWLAVEKTCFEGKTQKMVWIHRIENLGLGKVNGVGMALIESAVQKSLLEGLEGRVKLIAISNSHLFYLKCGFIPDNWEYKYPDCVRITRFLKSFGLESGIIKHSYFTKDPIYQEAQKILTVEYNVPLETVDPHFIQTHWYWHENYPLKKTRHTVEFWERAQQLMEEPLKKQIVQIFMPMAMYLPDKSLEIWEKIIATPSENINERHPLQRSLRTTVLREYAPHRHIKSKRVEN